MKIEVLIFAVMIILTSCGTEYKMNELRNRTFWDNQRIVSESSLVDSYFVKFERINYTILVRSNICDSLEMQILEVGNFEIENDTLLLSPKLKKCQKMEFYGKKDLIYPYNISGNVCGGYLILKDTLLNVLNKNEVFNTRKVSLKRNENNELSFFLIIQH